MNKKPSPETADLSRVVNRPDLKIADDTRKVEQLPPVNLTEPGRPFKTIKVKETKW